MAQSITLTASMRSNLASLKSIQKQMDTTQERLSTGKKVNSAIDNASSFYQSRALTNRAGDLDALLDSMGQGIQTIQAANEGIEGVTSFVEQLKSIANSAYALDPTLDTYEDTINSYKEQFETIQTEISKLVKDSSYQGINLLTAGKLTVTFNESRSHRFVVQGDDIVAEMAISSANDWKMIANDTRDADLTNTAGDVVVKEGALQYSVIGANGNPTGVTVALGVDDNYYDVAGDGDTAYTLQTGETLKLLTEEVTEGGSYAEDIDKTLTELSVAIDYLRAYSTELGNNFTIIETRQNFTDALIDVLETGSDNLVLADMNEESANYLALQTRQQLATNSLSLASQSAQSILSLFN